MPFENDDFRRALDLVLAASRRGAADAGEALATAARIPDGDADAWLLEWTATAGAAWAAARGGGAVSARSHYLRAATYYAAALSQVAFSAEPEREEDLWRRQRACWDRAAGLLGGERVAVPYEDTALPAYFFRAPGAAPGEPRALVVLNNDSDGATSAMWTLGGAAAAERGHHWMTFDGPGQQAARYEQRLAFRPDWEAVLRPVADAMVARPDVDARRLAVVGAGQAGYWIPRALAFEHRFAAAVVDPGVVDVSTAWTRKLPDDLRERLEHGDHAGFDRDMHVAELFSPAMTARLQAHGAPYGMNGGSRYELFERLAAYRLGDEVARITTPLLLTEPGGEPLWPGQSRQLYDRLTGPRELLRFAGDDGPALREARIFDWLDGHLAPSVPSGGSAVAGY